jgi:hypothetical protein
MRGGGDRGVQLLAADVEKNRIMGKAMNASRFFA